MSLFRTAGVLYDAVQQGHAGVDAARAEFATSGNPIRAFRAFASHTDTPLDDQAATEAEAAIRTGLTWLAGVSRAAVAVAALAERAQDPAIRAAIDRVLDQGVDGAIDVGLRAGVLRATLRGWLEE
jgi:hypothetical protein